MKGSSYLHHGAKVEYVATNLKRWNVKLALGLWIRSDDTETPTWFLGLWIQLDKLDNFATNTTWSPMKWKLNSWLSGCSNYQSYFLNFVDLAEVNGYKNLGDVISPPMFPGQDPFKNIYQSLCDQAEKVTFAVKINSNLLRVYPLICC